jgi:hypothetical protein
MNKKYFSECRLAVRMDVLIASAWAVERVVFIFDNVKEGEFVPVLN